MHFAKTNQLTKQVVDPYSRQPSYKYSAVAVELTWPLRLTENPAMRVKIHNIWISPGHDFRGHHGKERGQHGVQSCQSVRCIAGLGIEGDRYFGYEDNFKGQITFFSEDIASRMEEALGIESLDRSAMRRNVLISGIDLNSLIGKRFRIGELVMTGSEECAPCYWMDKAVAPGAHEFLKGNGGLRCRFESSATLAVGESVLKIMPDA